MVQRGFGLAQLKSGVMCTHLYNPSCTCGFCGPTIQLESNTHLFTIVDRSSRWPEAVPIPLSQPTPLTTQPHFSVGGLPVLECLNYSHLRGGSTSCWQCGDTSETIWLFSTTQERPTIGRQTEWRNVFTDSLRAAYVPGCVIQTGSPSYIGSTGPQFK
jgi:hypothetical protein